MPSIRTIINKGQRDEREIWLAITDQHVRNNTLESFRINYSNGAYKDVYLFQHGNLFEIAAGLFGVATQSRSAKGLLEDFNKTLGRAGWAARAGVAGVAIGSATALYNFLKSKPFKQEGYYDSDDNLVLGRVIHTNNRNDYLPT